MKKIYRISTSEYISDLLGTGAKLHGGRWNEKGSPLLYCSENISLAILEILVHFDGLTIPNELQLLTLSIPEKEILNFSKSKFTKIKQSKNAEILFKIEGEKWINSGKSLALKVPSIITQDEFNIIINPKHPKFNKIKKIKLANLDLDQRLFKMKATS